MPYNTTFITFKWFLMPFLLLAPNSAVDLHNKASFSHSKTQSNYAKYNELTTNIPSSKDLIILNEKMDSLYDRAEELERSLDTIE